MLASGKFIPVRFLALIAHFVIMVTLLWSLGSHLPSCLHEEYSAEEFNSEHRDLTIGLSFGIALFGVEMVSFLLGVSMFKPLIGMISTFCHICACVTLSLFILEEWECYRYWYIFGCCSCVPAVFEVLVIVLFLLGKLR